MSVIYFLTQSRAYYRFCIVQIVVASIYSIMIVVAHPWGVTKTEFQTTSCFLAGKDWNFKTYCNKSRRERLSLPLRILNSRSFLICWLFMCASERVREGGLCVLVWVCFYSVCVSIMHKGGNKSPCSEWFFIFLPFQIFFVRSYLFFSTNFFSSEVTGHTSNDPRTDSLWTFLR